MTTFRTSLLALALCAVLVQPALAKKPDHAGAGREERMEQRETHERIERRDDLPMPPPDAFDIAIAPEQRHELQVYLHESYKKRCPPGLAKKHNGCVPPGLSKKYIVGDMLPPDYAPLPPHLVSRLGPPPAGTFYAMVDTDVVLVTEATKKILDAVTLLSAVK